MISQIGYMRGSRAQQRRPPCARGRRRPAVSPRVSRVSTRDSGTPPLGSGQSEIDLGSLVHTSHRHNIAQHVRARASTVWTAAALRVLPLLHQSECRTKCVAVAVRVSVCAVACVWVPCVVVFVSVRSCCLVCAVGVSHVCVLFLSLPSSVPSDLEQRTIPYPRNPRASAEHGITHSCQVERAARV